MNKLFIIITLLMTITNWSMAHNYPCHVDDEHRSWTSTQGSKVKAKLVSFKSAERITLEKENGKLIDIKIQQLSERDRQYCDDILRLKRNILLVPLGGIARHHFYGNPSDKSPVSIELLADNAGYQCFTAPNTNVPRKGGITMSDPLYRVYLHELMRQKGGGLITQEEFHEKLSEYKKNMFQISDEAYQQALKAADKAFVDFLFKDHDQKIIRNIILAPEPNELIDGHPYHKDLTANIDLFNALAETNGIKLRYFYIQPIVDFDYLSTHLNKNKTDTQIVWKQWESAILKLAEPHTIIPLDPIQKQLSKNSLLGRSNYQTLKISTPKSSTTSSEKAPVTLQKTRRIHNHPITNLAIFAAVTQTQPPLKKISERIKENKLVKHNSNFRPEYQNSFNSNFRSSKYQNWFILHPTRLERVQSEVLEIILDQE